MKLEIKDEDNYTTTKINGYTALIHRSYNYHSNVITNIGEDYVDIYGTNNISRVEYPREFYDDQEAKPLTILNLDDQNKRRASLFVSNYGDEPVLKKLLFSDDENIEVDVNRWRTKPTIEWEVIDTINWLICTGQALGHSFGNMSPNLSLTGKDLLSLDRQDFIYYDRNFGERLYNILHETNDSRNYLPPFDTLQKSSSDDEASIGCGNTSSDGESVCSPELIKKRPGRPRILDPKRKVAKVKLWEFIRNLLLDPKYCPAWICWEDYDKKRFRFVQSDRVAKFWGERKNNKNMTYEKFSRAMRYYYPKNIFVAVPGRRLVYDFGSKATGLETDNPNFDPNYYRNTGRTKLQ